MKYCFILNPKAGEGRLDAVRSQISNLSVKDKCEVYLTKAPLDATAYVRSKAAEATAEEPIRFIACGGDGTLNEVFNGAVGAENVSVSVYPCGSGNDFVKIWGGTDRFSNIEDIINAPEQPLDALKVGDKDSFNVTNFGCDTVVAITINKEREKTGHGNKNAYTKGVITALLKAMKNECRVWADGELLNPKGKMLLCTVANGQYVGGSFKCAPRAKTDDGLMEVCLIKPISRIKFVQILGTYTRGEHLDNAGMQKIMKYRQARRVDVEAPEGFAYSLDGEIVYENKFSIEIVPAALRLAVPEK